VLWPTRWGKDSCAGDRTRLKDTVYLEDQNVDRPRVERGRTVTISSSGERRKWGVAYRKRKTVAVEKASAQSRQKGGAGGGSAPGTVLQRVYEAKPVDGLRINRTEQSRRRRRGPLGGRYLCFCRGNGTAEKVFRRAGQPGGEGC